VESKVSSTKNKYKWLHFYQKVHSSAQRGKEAQGKSTGSKQMLKPENAQSKE
jgi:hypothetical protein